MADDIRDRNQYEEKSMDTNRQLLGFHKEITKNLKEQSEYLGDIVVEEAKRLDAQKKGESLSEDELKNIEDIYSASKKRLQVQKESLRTQRQSNRALIERKKLGKSILGFLQESVKYWFEVDGAIKEVLLSMGMTSGKGQDFRLAIEDSAIQAARLGMTTKDLVKSYSSYVDQVGRVVSMNGEQMEAMAALTQGTGLVNTEAAKLAGQFELMGKDIISVNQTVEGIMETSERMGVNATKVLKAVSGDFKRLQTYTFRSGVQGMGKMAAYGEKFKIDIGTALDAAEKSRRLEGAVELAAQLQVLGGEFAKSDPFEMLFLSRNDPEKFQKKIAELTKGMTTLNKTADGFEYQLASPMARDLLEQAGKALGISLDKMTEMAFQQKKIGDMRKQMFDSGYTKEQREAVEGLAQMDSSTGKFFVNVKGARKDIANLGSEELKYLQAQNKSLEQRAKDAQTFDKQFQIFMSELKAVGLPLLQGINAVLNDYIRPTMDWLKEKLSSFSDSSKDIMKKIGGGVAALLLLKPLLGPMLGVVGGLFKFVGKIGTGAFRAIFKKGGAKTAVDTMTGGAAGKGGGFGAALGKGAGVGLAGLGIGVGIGEAAKGIAELAKAMKELDTTQIWGLAGTTAAITVAMYAMIPALGAMPPLILALGTAGTAGSVGLLALGAAAAGVGFGIKMVGQGIKAAGEGVGSIVSSITDGVTGIINASREIKEVDFDSFTKNQKAIASVSNSLSTISVALRGSKDDYAEVRATIDAISRADFSNLKALSNLNQLFSQPLKVQFEEKDMTMVANITMEIDGDRFVENLRLEEKMGFMTRRAQNGGVA